MACVSWKVCSRYREAQFRVFQSVGEFSGISGKNNAGRGNLGIYLSLSLPLRLMKEFGRKSQLLAGSLNCAYLCSFASVRSRRNTWHVYKEIGREENARRSGTRETGTTNALCPQSTYRSSVSFSSLSFAHAHNICLSLSISCFSSRWQPLHLRSVLIFGGALIYQRVYPSTTRAHPRSILHSLHLQHAHEHPESESALTRPAPKFIKESSFALFSSATVVAA